MKKHFNLLTLAFLGFSCLCSCGDNGGSYYYSSTYRNTTSTKNTTTTYVSDKQKITNHIKNIGSYSSPWYMVTCSIGTSLGYNPSSDIFGIYYGSKSDNVIAKYAGVLSYGDYSIYGGLEITINSSTVFDVNYSTTVSNHKFSSIVTNSISVNYTAQTTDKWYEACTEIMLYNTQTCINNISSYLSSRSLPYLY